MTDELSFDEMMEKMRAYRLLTADEAQRAIDGHQPIPRTGDPSKDRVYDAYEDFVAYLTTTKDDPRWPKEDGHD